MRPRHRPSEHAHAFRQACVVTIRRGLTFNLGSGLTLLLGWNRVSWVLQAMLVVAFSLLLFGKFCLGAYVFHVLRGEVAFANKTLPWARD